MKFFVVLLVVTGAVAGCTKNKEKQKPKNLVATGLTGKELVMKKACVACHSLDGSRKMGPSLKGLWGKQATLADGSTVLRDAEYMKAAILNIKKYDIKGYPNGVMPIYEGSIHPDDLNELVKFIESLRE